MIIRAFLIVVIIFLVILLYYLDKNTPSQNDIPMVFDPATYYPVDWKDPKTYIRAGEEILIMGAIGNLCLIVW